MNWKKIDRKNPPEDMAVLVGWDNYIGYNAAVALFTDGKWILFHTSTGDYDIGWPDYYCELPKFSHEGEN